jgi:hypothetical protein
MEVYCNPGCKNTIFESGKDFPKSLEKKLMDNKTLKTLKNKKLNKMLLSLSKDMRKNIFGNNTNVLNEDFYKKLNKKLVSSLKKEGALSGCTIMAL